MIYTLTLNPALDYVLEVENLTSLDINRAKSDSIYYGGKGINVSVILTRLGIDNTALGFVAGFTGQEIEKMLTADGIKTDFNYLKNGYTRINVKLKANTEIDVNANGPAIDSDDINSLFEKLDKISEGDFLVLAGSVPNNISSDIYEKILRSLNNRGVNFVVDATDDLLLNTLKYKPFLIKPNHIELGAIFNKDLKSDDEIIYYARELRSRGAKNVLVSMAENGAILVDENDNTYKIENANGKLINSVGCGDSMVAGFIAGYIQNGDYQSALRLATACGNATAFSPSLATRDEIMNIFNNN